MCLCNMLRSIDVDALSSPGAVALHWRSDSICLQIRKITVQGSAQMCRRGLGVAQPRKQFDAKISDLARPSILRSTGRRVSKLKA